jgi:signal transduction histidine kinase/ligand-binding sensor domain-containing protein/ActR/RegA family two-component response regulator
VEQALRRADRDRHRSLTRLRVRPIVVGALLWCGLAARHAAAQWTSPIAGLRSDDVSVQWFAARDGLTQSSVFAVWQSAAGVLYIGHDEGISRYTGRRWVAVESPDGEMRHTRGFVEFDGWQWSVGRSGVERRRGTEWEFFDHRTGGIPDGTVYSIVVTHVFGEPTVVVGGGSGIARWSGAGFVPVPLPPGFNALGLMLAETQTGDTPTLWVASASDGVARYENGRWTVESSATGFPMVGVEQLVVAPAGFGAELWAVGDDGVFERRGGRWRRLEMPRVPAYRLLPITRASGARELWVASRSGLLLRRQGAARWDTVQVSPRGRRAPIIALASARSPTGEPAVYVGMRGDRLARLSLGPALGVALPGELSQRFLRAMARRRGSDGQDELWLGTVANGAARLRAGVLSGLDTPGLPALTVLGLAARRTASSDELWVATGRGPARFIGNAWRPETLGLGAKALQAFTALDVSGSTDQRLFGVGDGGLYEWTNGRWVRDSTLAATKASGVARAADGRWWVSSSAGLYVRDSTAGWQRDTAFPLGMGLLNDVRVVTLEGRSVLTVASAARGFAWRQLPNGPWHVVNAATHPGIIANYVWSTAAIGNRLYVAGPEGVAAFRLIAPDSLRVDSHYAEEDGLPSSDAMSLLPDGDGGVWVGTVRGLGHIPAPASVTNASATTTAPLRATVTAGARGEPLASGAVIPAGWGAVSVELALESYHREYNTTYAIELVGSDLPPTGFSPRATYTFGALRPGRYELRARARDWLGREATLEPFAFRVAPPWWQTWPARLGLLGLIGAIATLAYRARVAVLKTRADDLERNERALLASERKFRSLFDRSSDGHLLFEGSTLIAANEAAKRLFGVKDLVALMERASHLTRHISGGLVTGGAADTGAIERVITRADGVEVYVEQTRTTIPTASGSLEHLVLRDLSAVRAAEAERAQLESQLREAQKLESIGTLAGGIAHDFNNLLSVIRGNTELAIELGRSGATVQQELAQVLSAADRARDLVRQMLTFSRRTRARTERVDMGALVYGLRDMARAAIPTTVELRVSAPERPAVVLGDSTQLQQAVLNLLTNAEHAMRRTNGGTLTVRVEDITEAEGPGWILVTVADTGTGIPPEVRERMFEPFFTTKAVGEGTGLGLAVLHGIITSHGGTVSVDSTVGVGTRFELRLPRAPEDVGGEVLARTSDGARTTLLPRLGAGQHVALVDDEPAVRLVSARALRAMGFVVHDFDDPRVALDAVSRATTPFAALVTDQMMPGMTGDVLIRELRRQFPTLAVILMTGYAQRLPDELGLPPDAAVLQKPVNLDELGRAVAEQIAASAAE